VSWSVTGSAMAWWKATAWMTEWANLTATVWATESVMEWWRATAWATESVMAW
jgi:hypothetical protein